MAYGAFADPRVTTVGIWNSGLLQPDEQIFTGLHSSVIIVTGGESDIAYAHPSVGHGGTHYEDNGGAFGVAAVAWLKWQLMNDMGAAGKGYFVGNGCRLCADAKWQAASRTLR
jgi:hypothetical protein